MQSTCGPGNSPWHRAKSQARAKSFPPVLASQAQCADFRSLFVPLTVLCSPVIEVDLPCGAVVRVHNDRSSLRRGLSVLIAAGSVTPRRVATDSKLAKKSLHAHHVLAVITKLYKVKSDTRERAAAARLSVRQQAARPLLNDLKRWLVFVSRGTLLCTRQAAAHGLFDGCHWQRHVVSR